jgi:hypothetical protein
VFHPIAGDPLMFQAMEKLNQTFCVRFSSLFSCIDSQGPEHTVSACPEGLDNKFLLGKGYWLQVKRGASKRHGRFWNQAVCPVDLHTLKPDIA